MKFFESFFLFFNCVLMSYAWKTNAYFESLKLENSKIVVIRSACDSQTSCAYRGGKTRAEVL